MNCRLLLVEDDKLDQLAVIRLIKESDLPYDCEAAASVAAARQRLTAERYDVILCDYELPDGTGFDLLADVPDETALIFVTGAGSEETAIKALRAGANDYLVKDHARVYLKFLPLTIERTLRQKRTERELWTLSKAVKSSSDSIYVTNLNGLITHVNPAFCATYGYDPDEIIGKHSQILQAHHNVTRKVKGTSELEGAHRRWDGSSFPVSLSHETVEDDNGLPFAHMAIVRDITQRREAEAALRESEERYRSLVSVMADGVILQDQDGCIRACNGSAERIFNLKPGEYENDTTVPESWQLLREDGSRVALEEFPTHITLATGEPQHQVILGVEAVDGDLTWISMNTEPLWRQGENQPYGVVASFADITQLKNILAERDQLITQLDSFAHTVAHDLKNPAALIYSYSTLLSGDFAGLTEQDFRQGLTAMEASAKKMNEIIEALLMLAGTSGMPEVPLGPIDMATVVEAVQARLQHKLTDADARFVIATDLLPVEGYAPWIEEMLVNYVSNAVKYGGEPPVVTVGAEFMSEDQVRYWVKDNGRGLTDEQQSQLFQPFKRLDVGAADGHGLGLSIVSQIAERLGGSVAVSSRVGHGSVFSFTLPAVTAPTPVLLADTPFFGD